MRQEPIAWMNNANKYWLILNEAFVMHKKDKNWWTPLYRAPRELSDEEILEVEQQVNKELESKGHGIMWFDDGIYVFARAILKKANEERGDEK